MDRQELTDKFFKLREVKDTLTKDLKSVNEEMELIEQSLIAAMENDGLEMFRDKNGMTVFLEADVKASIDDQDQAFSWLRENGHGDVIQERIMPSTLTALVKEVAMEIPGVKKYEFTKVRYRRNGK